MSYRALITVINKAPRGDYLHVADFVMRLDEDFKMGEVIAEELGALRNRDKAYEAAMNHPELSAKHFDSYVKRKAWKDTWADQEWLVTFQTAEDGLVKVEITGNDGADSTIFFRSTVYAD